MKTNSLLKYLNTFLSLLIIVSISSNSFAQTSNTFFNPDTIKAGRFDTGKMWTFEYPPMDYFKVQYNFSPDEKWFEHVRLSTLKFATYCSASFVSEDGLIMTNHHCARESVTEISGMNENFHKDGFIAEDLEDEKPVPGLFVDQCTKIVDVTKEMYDTLNVAKSEEESIKIEEEKIKEIENRYTDEKKGIIATVTPLTLEENIHCTSINGMLISNWYSHQKSKLVTLEEIMITLHIRVTIWIAASSEFMMKMVNR